MKITLLAGVIVTFIAATAAGQDGVEAELLRLQGIWRFANTHETRAESDEAQRYSAWMAEFLVLVIQDRSAKVYECGDNDELGMLLDGRIVVDPTAKPKAMDLNIEYFLPETQYPDILPEDKSIKGKTLRAIYALSGNDLKLSVAGPARDRPRELLATAGRHGALYRIGRTFPGMRVAAFSPKGFRVAAVVESRPLRLRSVKIWDAAQGTELMILADHGGPVTQLIFTANGKRLISGTRGLDRRVRVWEPSTGELLREFRPLLNDVQQLFVGSDGKQILAAAYDRRAPLEPTEIVSWELESGRERFDIRHALGRAPVLSADGTLVAGTKRSGEEGIVLWSTRSGKIAAELNGPYSVELAALSPDGRLFAVVEDPSEAARAEQPVLRIWNLTGVKPTVVWELPFAREGEETFHGLSFSPNGQLLAVPGTRRTRVWDVTNGQLVQELVSMTPVVDAVFSRDGKYLAAACRMPEQITKRHQVVVWELNQGRQIRRFLGQPGGASSVAFSSNGHRLLSAGPDSVVVWDLDRDTQVPQGRPIRDLIRATLSGNLKLLEGAFSDEMQKVFEQEGWGSTLKTYSRLFAENYGEYNLSDFRFRFEGDETSGKVRVAFKERRYAESGLDVVKEGLEWKLNER